MRSVICLLLVLVFCMHLPCTACAFTPSAADSGTPAVTPSGSSPKTGDAGNMQLWVSVMIISLLALTALLVIYFKKARKQ